MSSKRKNTEGTNPSTPKKNKPDIPASVASPSSVESSRGHTLSLPDAELIHGTIRNIIKEIKEKKQDPLFDLMLSGVRINSTQEDIHTKIEKAKKRSILALNCFLVGKTGIGKSFAINGIVGHNVVYQSDAVNSATQYCYSVGYGDKWRYNVILNNNAGKKTLWEGPTYSEWDAALSAKNAFVMKHAADISHFEILCPVHILKYITLWDTPGVNDEIHAKAAKKLINSYADVIFFFGHKRRFIDDLKTALVHLDEYLDNRTELPQIVFVPNFFENTEDQGKTFTIAVNESDQIVNAEEYAKNAFRELFAFQDQDTRDLPKLTGHARHKVQTELLRYCLYFTFSSPELFRQNIHDNLEYMFAVRTHYKLIDVLPNALTFCTWMKISVQSVKAMSKCTNIPIKGDLALFKQNERDFIGTNPFDSSIVTHSVSNGHQNVEKGFSFVAHLNDRLKQEFCENTFPRNVIDCLKKLLDSCADRVVSALLSHYRHYSFLLLRSTLKQEELPKFENPFSSDCKLFAEEEMFEFTELITEEPKQHQDEDDPNDEINPLDIVLRQLASDLDALLSQLAVSIESFLKLGLKDFISKKNTTFKACLDKMEDKIDKEHLNLVLHELDIHLKHIANDAMTTTKRRKFRPPSQHIKKDINGWLDGLSAKIALANPKSAQLQADQIGKNISELRDEIVYIAKRVNFELKAQVTELTLKDHSKMLPPPQLRVENTEYHEAMNDRLAKLQPEDVLGKKRVKASWRNYSKVLKMPQVETAETVKSNQDCLFDIRFSAAMKEEGYSVPADEQIGADTPWATRVNVSLNNDPRIKMAVGGNKTTTQEGDELNISIPRKVLGDVVEQLQKVIQYTERKDENNNNASTPAFFPIFMVSKGRCGKKEGRNNAFIGHIPTTTKCIAQEPGSRVSLLESNPTNTLEEGSSAIVFLLAEAQEFEEYSTTFGPSRDATQQIIMVEIPGSNRGVGFARQMALLLQKTLSLCLVHQVPWHYFFLLDDDLKELRMYDRERFYMRPCSLSFVLHYLQQVMLGEIAKKDNREHYLSLFQSNQEGDEELQEQLDSLINDFYADYKKLDKLTAKISLDKAFIASIKQIVKASDHPLEVFLEDPSVPFFNQVGDLIAKSTNNKEQLVALLKAFKTQLFRNLWAVNKMEMNSIAFVSVPPRHSAENRNYNEVPPFATHRVSKQHHALVMVHSRAVHGFGYLSNKPFKSKTREELEVLQPKELKAVLKSLKIKGNHSKMSKEKLVDKCLEVQSHPHGFNELLVPQAEVDRRCKNQTFILNKRYGYLGEDKLIANKLFESGRGGYLVYLFNASYGTQHTGGCWSARKELPLKQRFATS